MNSESHKIGHADHISHFEVNLPITKLKAVQVQVQVQVQGVMQEQLVDDQTNVHCTKGHPEAGMQKRQMMQNQCYRSCSGQRSYLLVKGVVGIDFLVEGMY